MLIFSTLCVLSYEGLATERVYAGHTTKTHLQRDQQCRGGERRASDFSFTGVYTVPAGTHQGQAIENIGEWIMHYGRSQWLSTRPRRPRPTQYDPEAWVLMAKDGMKYIVITAKHHDGFALFNTDVSDWNVVKATPYGKNVLKPLAAAALQAWHKTRVLLLPSSRLGAPRWGDLGGRWDSAQEGDMDHICSI